MKNIGERGFEFPETADEAKAWEPHTERHAMHHEVLVHARTRTEGAWAAYCYPVPGRSHRDEEHLWREIGAKLPSDIALAIFPSFAGIPYAK